MTKVFMQHARFGRLGKPYPPNIGNELMEGVVQTMKLIIQLEN